MKKVNTKSFEDKHEKLDSLDDREKSKIFDEFVRKNQMYIKFIPDSIFHNYYYQKILRRSIRMIYS